MIGLEVKTAHNRREYYVIYDKVCLPCGDNGAGTA